MTADRHELPVWECLELLTTQPFGRLCVMESGCPVAIPVNFKVSDDHSGGHLVVVRTHRNTVIGRYSGPASLEVDDVDLLHGKAWSVIARGELVAVHGSHALADPEPLLSDRTLWMTVRIASVSGRRFIVGRGADGYSVDWQIG